MDGGRHFRPFNPGGDPSVLCQNPSSDHGSLRGRGRVQGWRVFEPLDLWYPSLDFSFGIKGQVTHTDLARQVKEGGGVPEKVASD